MGILEVVGNVFRVSELRKKLFFTLGMLAVYRLGCQIPTPGVHILHWAEYIRQHQDSFWGIADLFSGGSMSGMTIFALGITLYITALDHPAANDRGDSFPGALTKRGRTGTKKDLAMDPVSHRNPGSRAVVRQRGSHSKNAGKLRPIEWTRFLPADHDSAHRGKHIRDVVRRADHRARDRERRFTAHLHQHSGGSSEGAWESLHQYLHYPGLECNPCS